MSIESENHEAMLYALEELLTKGFGIKLTIHKSEHFPYIITAYNSGATDNNTLSMIARGSTFANALRTLLKIND